MITLPYVLDMYPRIPQTVVHLSQYDEDFQLVFTLITSHGTLDIQSGTTVAIRGTKTDGNGYSVDATLDVANKTVTVVGDIQMTASAGRNVFELTLYKDSKELNTTNFIIDVERAALDKDTLASESKIRELVNVIDRTDEIIAAAHLADESCDTVRELEASAQQAKETAEQKASEASQSASQADEAMRTAKSTIEEETEKAKDAIDSDKATALQEIEADYQQKIGEINRNGEQIVAITTQADQTAAQALSAANNAENHMAQLDNQMRQVSEKLDNVSIDPDDLGLEQDPDTYYVYPTYRGVRSENGIPLSAGGGGGGGGGEVINAKLTVEDITGWNAKSFTKGSDVKVKFRWSSIENELPTGDGAVRITVGDVVRRTYQIPQGEVEVDVTPYLSTGSNKVKIRISDVYDQGSTKTFNVSILDLSISSTLDTTAPFTGSINIPVTPVGAVEKTVRCFVDGVEKVTQKTNISGNQIVLAIPAQSHGAHSLLIYFDADINGETVRSNELYYEIKCIEPLNDTVIITSSFNKSEVAQYSSVPIPFSVYDPKSQTAEVEIYDNDTLVSAQTVDRAEQSYTLRVNDVGQRTVKIKCGTIEKVITFNVIESEIDVEAETQNLALYLSAAGRSNGEQNPAKWEYESIQSSFSGFTWVLDGWQKDEDGIGVLRLSDEARLTIPYKIFERDFKTSGKTIEIEFATREVANYNATILSCLADDIGLTITPQMVTFKGAQTELTTLYKDNEHIRLSIVVEKQNENRLLLIYINGVMSRAIQYASGERFSQLNPVNITIGSDDCGIDIYCIRVYDNNLNRRQVLNNWIADTQVGSLMLERYTHNNVYDAYGKITASNLPTDLPYFIIECPQLPQFKGDKKTVSGSYVNPLYPSRGFTFEGCEIDAQGTSSSVYYVKNLDMKFKKGFVTPNGNISNYSLRPGSIPFNRFVLKADVASIEGWNNTGLTMFYNETCPYKTPEMVANSKVRWGIEGIPIVCFWLNTDTGVTTFIGKYNFNLPKRAPEPYGYGEDDTLESWEWERNNSANVKFQDNDFTSQSWDETKQENYPTWYDDFEARFPSDTFRDITQLNEFLSWVKSTWRQEATGEDLAEPITYTLTSTATLNAYLGDTSYTVVERTISGGKAYDITFTKDTPAYRLTKFRAELGNYAEIQSAVFYYLFTEQFLMIDSRAKNMFVGFNGSVVS